ncbi:MULTISPECIES: peptide chain release factor N(5)-glutamine methyltransferase [Psychrobacter]|uniref:peptide chain release factor N(5)-glutamine methyltransferase n=1 Tax=Psychrobacter TaxID=497 RepID=UPI00146A3EC4|nr:MULTISPECIES: peptide chain release factor N(5)-glutamine methyltransferase [Psychrobacter]
MTTIRQIKKEVQAIIDGAVNQNLPAFWITDWLLFVIDKSSTALITENDYELTLDELSQFYSGIKQMQNGTPLAYLTGKQAFWRHEFLVNEHTLIPRPDTEILVEAVLNWIEKNWAKQNNEPSDSPKLLDLGTGSGCIAISLATEKALQGWQVTAVDISKDALLVAEKNAKLNNARVNFVQSSWFAAFDNDESSLFDVIVSNPPYIDETDSHLTGLTAEPITALTAKNQGLADIDIIVQNAPDFLQNNGLLAIEHGFDQGINVRKLFENRGFSTITTLKDFGQNDRVTLGVWVGNKQ